MPLAMEYVNGIKTIVTNDGIAAVISEKSTSLTDPIIRTPTNIKAGAVTAFGMIVITGAITSDARNSNDVTNAAYLSVRLRRYPYSIPQKPLR